MSMDFLPTDEQQMMRDTMRQLVADARPLDAIEDGDDGERAWSAAVAIGLAGLLIPTAAGGTAMSAQDAVVVADAAGHGAAPSSLTFSALIGPAALALACATDLAAGAARGEIRVTVAPLGVVEDHVLPLVPDGAGADLVVARSAASVVVVEGRGQETFTYDPTRTFADVAAGSPVAILAKGPEAEDLWEQILQYGALLMAADSVGAAERSLEMAVAYAKEREQFGKKIGSFQALKHLLVDDAIDVELARSATLHAAWAIDHAPAERALAASVAKVLASDTGMRVSADSVQVHGGIGYTSEVPVHLLLKRARLNAALFGSPEEHRAAIGAVLANSDPPGW